VSSTNPAGDNYHVTVSSTGRLIIIDKSPRWRWWLAAFGLAAAAATVIVAVCIAVGGEKPIGDLVKDLGSSDPDRVKSAVNALIESGPGRTGQLVEQYRVSADAVLRERIVRVTIRMGARGEKAGAVGALIEFLDQESRPGLRFQIVEGLRRLTGREDVANDPLGDDADAWRRWWRHQPGCAAPGN